MTDTGAVIANLTITNGFVDSGGGGGLFMSQGLVSNCLIAGCVSFSTGAGGVGGGIRMSGGRVLGCEVAGNKIIAGDFGSGGGGVYMSGGILSNCTITGNTTTNYNFGGGISSDGGLISHCTVSGNISAYLGGGVRIWGPVIVTNCTIVGNTANGSGSSGGGICFFSGGGSVYNCTIGNNSATSLGGGIHFKGGSGSLVQNCLISSNSALSGGGVFGDSRGGLSLQNCVISGNSSLDSGGGLYMGNNSTSTISACTIAGNYANSFGGGIWFFNSTEMVFATNSVIWSNSAGSSTIPGTEDIYPLETRSNMFYYSCSLGLGNTTQGDITNNPVFVDAAGGDWRLKHNSPCINTGSNQGWMTEAVDLDGRRRIDRFSGRVDMGAYEFLPAGTMLIGR